MKTHLNRLVSLALLLLYTFSQLSLVIDSIGCTVRPAFYLWVALLCASTWYTTSTKRGLWIGMPISALLLFAAYRYFDSNLAQQLNDVFDRLTGAYMEQIVFPGEAYPYINTAADHSLLFVFLGYLLASYMGAAITSRSGRIGLTFLGSMPFFAACLAVTPKPPVLAVFGMLLFWFLLAIGGNHYADDSNSYLSVIGMLFPLTLLLSLLLLYVNPDTYEYEPSRVDLSVEFDRLIQSLDDWLSDHLSGERLSNSSVLPSADIEDDNARASEESTNMLWQNRRGDLDLTQSFDTEDLEKTFLRVRTEQSGSLYLRAVSYGAYTGTGWAQTEESASLSSLAFTARAIAAEGGDERRLRVELSQDSVYRCLPYFSTEENGYDSFVPSGLQSSYTSAYYAFPPSFSSLQIPASLGNAELAYRDYAHEYYTRLPDSTRNALQSLCGEAGLYPGMDDLVSQVASYVQRTGTYDLETEPYPNGDYALYFLTSAKRGYCIHFATAAAALYRSLGVPARITEGFLVEAKGGQYTEVKGVNAHAWVEIYQDGLGWLPVEVTGQSGLDTDALGARVPEAEAEPQPEENAEPQPDASSDGSAQTESVQLQVGMVTQPSPEDTRGEHKRNSVRNILEPLLGLALLAALVPLRRLLLLTLRNRRFEQADTRRAVIAMYRIAQKAAAFGAELPDELVTCAERAAFSRHEIKAEEVERCRDILYIMLKKCYLHLNPWGKFRFKYLRALL